MTLSVRYILKTLKVVIITALSLLIVRSFFVEPGIVNGRSMEPSFLDADFFLINKFVLLTRKPERGDVVQVIFSEDGGVVIKRIIGVPGDTVSVERNGVYIANASDVKRKLNEPYLKEGTLTRSETREAITYSQLKENEYIVLGDNRAMSSDSRSYGPIFRDQINGLVINLSSFIR